MHLHAVSWEPTVLYHPGWGRKARTFAMTDVVKTAKQLEILLATPTEPLVQALGRLEGDILFLGVGGKMGSSLARMARRASDAAGVKRNIIGVSRFSTRSTAAQL